MWKLGRSVGGVGARQGGRTRGSGARQWRLGKSRRGKGRVRERVEKAGCRSFTCARQGGSEGSIDEPRGASGLHGRPQRHCFHRPEGSNNTTANIPLTPILRVSVTPKPRRISKNSINKSCRSTYQLQLLLKLQRLIRPGLGDTRFQSGVHEN